MSSARLRNVTDRVRTWVEEEGVQTMVVLAARRGVVVLHEAFGRMAPDPGAPRIRPDAVFRLASITKVLTATALLTLVEEGRVGLNRPVSSYIPEFRGEGKDAVLVRHLLTHTSGLREDELEAYAKEEGSQLKVPPAPERLHPLFHEYLARRYAAPLWKRPGEEMSYADYNFDLAAEIVSRVANLPLDRFARERIFQPLGMSSSFYCLIDVPRERRVIRPAAPGSVADSMSLAAENERFWAGSGFASSTARDMAVFGQMFLNGGAYGSARVLSPASVAAMTRDQIPGVKSVFFDQVFPEAGWGFGWALRGLKTGWEGALPSPETFEHLGNGGVCIWADPRNEIVGTCFSAAPPSASAADFNTLSWAAKCRNDLFMDAVTAAIVET